MKIITALHEMSEISRSYARNGTSTALVPTMGALHVGHLSLLGKARELADVSIISIFVNPTQFGPREDLSKYPRPFEKDCEMAEKHGCDIVFSPDVKEMYPEGFRTFVDVESLNSKLCGVTRPTHFRGVTTVVLKLFNVCMPSYAVFGQKDAQQVIILKRMAEDLNLPVKMVTAPTVREKDGLAMSSRNVYLTPSERSEAQIVQAGLKLAEKIYAEGDRNAENIRSAISACYAKTSFFSAEYIEIVDIVNLEPLNLLDKPALIAVACRTSQSKTRLIDNVILGGNI
jgi:pantoate--beta-alanine ligase